MEILVFRIASERYGVPLSDVREVLHAVAVTRVPGLPAAVAGVVDVRGELEAVFDVRRRLGLPGREARPEDHFIRARAGGRTVLLHVDRADRVERVEAAALERAGALAEGDGVVAGAARLGDGLVLIHDLDAFLSPREAAELEAALRAQGGGR